LNTGVYAITNLYDGRLYVGSAGGLTAWQLFVNKWKDCTDCPLCEERDRIVLARGHVPADVVFIGEAPGASENAIGFPFVGPAGHLLDQIIERALPPTVKYALTNLVACYPAEAKSRGDNEPEHNDITACRPRLVEFVNIAQPKLIVCVGALATQYVDHLDTVKCCDIVHPAHILRMPLAQKQMAVQKTIVQLRCAVDTMVQSKNIFTKWGANADLTPSQGMRQRYNAWTKTHANIDIPF